MSDVSDFLGHLFPGERDRPVCLWTKVDKLSHYFTDLNEAATFAEGKPDVYVHCGLPAKAGPAKSRVSAAQVVAIPGVWADIDINGGPEEKKGAAPDMEAAVELASAILEPTLLVNSGWGVHAWWLLEDGPWYFDDREAASALTRGWQERLRREVSWDIDPTADLSRVLRLPGTLNGKNGGKRPLTLIDGDDPGPRYALSALQAAAVTVKAQPQLGAVDTIVLREVPRQPPKLEMAAEVDERWWPTIQGRRDFKDQSASTYDLALANLGVTFNWTDQEIVDLLIWRRKISGEGLKLDRLDYYTRTLAKARSSSAKDDHTQRIDTAFDALEGMTARAKAGEPAPNEAVMHAFNELVGGPRIKELIQDGTDPQHHHFRLVLADGREVPLGQAKTLLNLRLFQEAFMVVTQHVLRVSGTGAHERWHNAVQALLSTAKINEEDTRVTLMLDWLRQYLDDVPGYEEAEAVPQGLPFIKSGKIYVTGGGMLQWLKVKKITITREGVGSYLRACGFDRGNVNFERENGSRTSRSYYSADESVLDG